MSKQSLGRAGLLLVSLLGVMSVFSASALAVGKPTSVSSGLSTVGASITQAHLTGSANPNGASTTVRIEYRKSSESEYKTALTQEIGSGTSIVQVNAMVAVVPSTSYSVRTSATNSYGTTYSSIRPYLSGWEEVLGSMPSTFSSSGSWKLEQKMGSVAVKIECADSSYGTIGTAGAAEDGVHVQTSGCAYYQDGKQVCSLKPIFYTMDGAFKVVNNLAITLCGPEGSEAPLTFSEPMSVEMPVEKYKSAQPITLTGKPTFNGSAATVTIASTWSLTGEDLGKQFGVCINCE